MVTKKRFAAMLLMTLLVVWLGGTALAAAVEFTGVCGDPSINAALPGAVQSGSCLKHPCGSSTGDRGVIGDKVLYGDVAGSAPSKCSYYSGGFEYVYGEVYVFGDSYIRQWPDLYGSKLGVAYKGAILDFLGDISTDSRGVDWYRVVFGNGSGWISSMYTILDEYDF